MPVVGFLGPETPALFADRLPAFQQALSEAGLVEGRSVAIEYRWAEGQNDRLPALAADLVRRQVSVIVAPGSTPAVLAAKDASGLSCGRDIDAAYAFCYCGLAGLVGYWPGAEDPGACACAIGRGVGGVQMV